MNEPSNLDKVTRVTSEEEEGAAAAAVPVTAKEREFFAGKPGGNWITDAFGMFLDRLITKDGKLLVLEVGTFVVLAVGAFMLVNDNLRGKLDDWTGLKLSVQKCVLVSGMVLAAMIAYRFSVVCNEWAQENPKRTKNMRYLSAAVFLGLVTWGVVWFSRP